MKCFVYTICLSLLFVGCSDLPHDYELSEESFGIDTLQMIEEDSGIILPSDAHGLNFFYKAPIDPAFVAKIQIPAASKEEILQRISKIQNVKVNITGALGPKFSWWLPAKAKVLIDRETSTGSSYLRVILTEENERIILYIESAVI